RLLTCCTLYNHFVKLIQCSLNLYIYIYMADLGGQGSTSDVVQSIMREIQSTGPLTEHLTHTSLYPGAY
uniref:Uncharacterized protein n=1 Tax=Oncorhynchus kisutch TaxID=8019 RepID=A0A8C7LC87_ONCKI